MFETSRRDQFRWNRELLVRVDRVNMGQDIECHWCPCVREMLSAYHTLTFIKEIKKISGKKYEDIRLLCHFCAWMLMQVLSSAH